MNKATNNARLSAAIGAGQAGERVADALRH